MASHGGDDQGDAGIVPCQSVVDPEPRSLAWELPRQSDSQAPLEATGLANCRRWLAAGLRSCFLRFFWSTIFSFGIRAIGKQYKHKDNGYYSLLYSSLGSSLKSQGTGAPRWDNLQDGAGCPSSCYRSKISISIIVVRKWGITSPGHVDELLRTRPTLKGRLYGHILWWFSHAPVFY